MNRRPHWDDDLIEAVSCLVSVDIGDDCLVVADVYAIIAAVEDNLVTPLLESINDRQDTLIGLQAERAEAEVQRLHRVIAESLPYIDFAEQFAQAEAAIARVREVCDQADEDGTALVWLADVRRALDGGAE